LYTVEKFAPFSYKILYVLLNCKENLYQCKSEHKPGTAFGHFLLTAVYFLSTQDTSAEHLLIENST
jgi:hypothetical protein